jgi:hypothetical protein
VTVPKTTIEEQADPMLCEHDIWLTRQIAPMKPKAKAFAKQAPA